MEGHIGSTEILAFVALAIMIAPTLAGWVRMPGLIGFVLAGTVLGPYVLGWLPEGSVDPLGQIGLLYLMFQAGLEIDMNTFEKNRSAAVMFGLLGFTFPFLFGMAEGSYILGFSLASAALIGSIWASHTLVTLPDVREAGLSASRAVTTTAGATIITDTLALIVLAVVTAEGDSPAAVLSTVLLGLVVLAAYCFIVLPWVGRHFFRGTGQARALRFAFMLFALTSAGVLSDLFGIEGLVGAFLAGLGVNRLAPHGGPLMERIDFFGEALFVPAFLVYVGTKIDPAVLLQPQTIVMALLFLAALLGGKGLAAFIAGKRLKFSGAEIGMMFGMTIPQAAATLAATLVGAEAGLLPPQVVNAVVFIVLTSIVMGSLITRRFAARIEIPAGATRPLGSSVLVGLAGETAVGPYMKIASAIAGGDDGLVMPMAVATADDRGTADAERLAKEATKAAESHGADVEARVRYATSYSGAMLDAIVERRASAVVMPMYSEGMGSRVFGGELDRVGRESPVPVIAVRLGSTEPAKIILGLDAKASSSADRYDQQIAVAVARTLSEAFELPLVVSARSDAAIDALTLPEETERMVGATPLLSLPTERLDDSVLVVPASLVRRLGPRASEFAGAHARLTTVIAAGPYRLRTSLGVPPVANYLGVTGGPAAAVALNQENPS